MELSRKILEGASFDVDEYGDILSSMTQAMSRNKDCICDPCNYEDSTLKRGLV